MALSDLLYIREAPGKNEKRIYVPKIRTMIPEANMYWDDVLLNCDIVRGRPVNDPRITRVGKILRRYWLDELPQLYSLLRGDLSLVGIRPKEDFHWKVYSEEHRKRVLQFKPGLVGIIYAYPKAETTEEIMIAETDYLWQKERRPFLTDAKFFLKIAYKILTGTRSR